MASLLTRGGRYYVQFYDASRTPTQKQLSLRTTDPRDAQRRQLDLEDAYKAGTFDPWYDDVTAFFGGAAPKELPCREALDRFLRAKEHEGRTPRTIKSYESVVGLFTRQHGMHRPSRGYAESTSRPTCMRATSPRPRSTAATATCASGSTGSSSKATSTRRAPCGGDPAQ